MWTGKCKKHISKTEEWRLPATKIPEINSSGTEVNTKISIQVSRLRMAMEVVIAKENAGCQIGATNNTSEPGCPIWLRLNSLGTICST